MMSNVGRSRAAPGAEQGFDQWKEGGGGAVLLVYTCHHR